MRKENYWKSISLLLIGIFIGVLIERYTPPSLPSEKVIQTDVKRDTIVDTLYVKQTIVPLNKENVLAELKRQKIHHPSIVLAQSLHETGKYKSKVCKTHNNLFGLTKKGKYRHYDNWKDCIVAYKELIQSKYKRGEDYYDFLLRIKYAEDVEYIDKVKKYV